MAERIHASRTASITEFKRNPQALINAAEGEVIALLNRNRTSAYIVPPDLFERLLELAEDTELGRIYESREAEKATAVEVGLDDL